MEIVKKAIVLVLFVCIGLYSFAQKATDENKPQNLIELKKSIQKILIETKIPGTGVVLVSGDETILLNGFGKADIEKNINANENTIFRLGSISKTLVALAILKLQEEGRLNLKDKIKDIIPEIKFTNAWEEKFPIRIENLLEHTSGWKYWSMAELGSDDPKPKTLKEALDFYPKTRTSLFVPGTRIMESNVGIAVAAYIVEKVSGTTFENFMDETFFKPMGIQTMSFIQTEQYKKFGASLYENNIKLNYLNIIYRPAAALNSSPADMAKFLKFFINRGKINNIQLLTDSSLCRMERAGSLQKNISKFELYSGNGLSNESSLFKGFKYHGFSGSLPGAYAEFGYIRENNMGYAVMINNGAIEPLEKIVSLIKYYQTKDLKQKSVTIDTEKHKIDIDPSGYYTCIIPKLDPIKALELIKNIHKVWIKNDTIYIKRLMDGGSLAKFISVGNNEFRSVETNQIGLVLINDPLEGNMIGLNLKKISPLWAYTLLSIFYLFFIVLFSSIVFGVISVFVYLFGKKKSKIALLISLLPIITYSFILMVAVLLKSTIHNRYDMFQIIGTMNPISILILICSICYVLATVWALFYIYKKYHDSMSRIFYIHSALATILNMIFMLYFFSNGLIGVPTWF
ncbi:MAG: serine hydrolase domain-containing protein [Bacteroidota bacterium]|nr:serine hydrolase domain-containing protein [Bacteroidota bacterium]